VSNAELKNIFCLFKLEEAAMEGNLFASSGWGWCQAHCQLDEEEDEDMKKKDSKSKHGSVKPLKCIHIQIIFGRHLPTNLR
jgi:hypothetical protein